MTEPDKINKIYIIWGTIIAIIAQAIYEVVISFGDWTGMGKIFLAMGISIAFLLSLYLWMIRKNNSKAKKT
jgi:hypothetical protein